MTYFGIKYIFAFLPAVISLYFIMPKKIKPFVLLLASYAMIFFISRWLIIFLVLSSLAIFLASIVMQKIDDKKNKLCLEKDKEEKKKIKEKYKRYKKFILIITILFNISFLFYFKYLGFFSQIANQILEIFKVNIAFDIVKFIAPIGISYYTLKAISYIVDVYFGKIEAEQNFFKVCLYLAFFPTIMEGPIARYDNVKDKIWAGNKITYRNLCFGYQRITFGLLKKYVIADRLNIFVKQAFKNYLKYSGVTSFVGAIFYTILLYMEFSGTMDIVIGSSEIFDITIPENFRQPFFSKNISEFWSRWHITLGTWFKDYIFYPVSLSKPVKKLTNFNKKVFNYRFASLIMGGIALFAVWSLNGLWHGAGLTFLAFGYYHFILIFLGNIFEPFVVKLCDKLKIKRQSKGYKFMQIIKTSLLVFGGELIFRAPTLEVAMGMFKNIFTNFNISTFLQEVLTLGMDIKDFIIVFLALIFILVISILKEKGQNIREIISKKPIYVRWILYYALILFVVIFGAYGSGYAPVDPIYADF